MGSKIVVGNSPEPASAKGMTAKAVADKAMSSAKTMPSPEAVSSTKTVAAAGTSFCKGRRTDHCHEDHRACRDNAFCLFHNSSPVAKESRRHSNQVHFERFALAIRSKACKGQRRGLVRCAGARKFQQRNDLKQSQFPQIVLQGAPCKTGGCHRER